MKPKVATTVFDTKKDAAKAKRQEGVGGGQPASQKKPATKKPATKKPADEKQAGKKQAAVVDSSDDGTTDDDVCTAERVRATEKPAKKRAAAVDSSDDGMTDHDVCMAGCIRRDGNGSVEYTSEWTPPAPCPPATTCYCALGASGKVAGGGGWSRLDWNFGAHWDGSLHENTEESFLLDEKSLGAVGSKSEHELRVGELESDLMPKAALEVIPHALVRTGCWALKQPFRVWSQADRATVLPLTGTQSDWSLRLDGP